LPGTNTCAYFATAADKKKGLKYWFGTLRIAKGLPMLNSLYGSLSLKYFRPYLNILSESAITVKV
jgi:hypothetical protein